MKQEIIPLKETAAVRDFDLGTWLGRRQAFSMVAGKASAADVECLRTIRDQRLYKSKNERWADFCAAHIGASKAHVDRLIQYLEEFGPSFFELTHVTRIAPETYRLIAENVTRDGLRLDQETIPLIQENSARISAAVAELRKRVEPPPATRRTRERPDRACRAADLAYVQMRFDEVVDALKDVGTFDRDQREQVRICLVELRRQAASLGIR